MAVGRNYVALSFYTHLLSRASQGKALARAVMPRGLTTISFPPTHTTHELEPLQSIKITKRHT